MACAIIVGMQSAMCGLRNQTESDMDNTANLAIGIEHAFIESDGTVSVSYNGARLQISAAGFHMWSNVQMDSEVYQAMNETAFAKLTSAH